MATIRVRRLGSDLEPVRGSGQNNFIEDAEAVRQIIYDSLNLFMGEWWEDLNLGLPVYQKMLAASASPRNLSAIALLIQKEILKVPYVSGIQDVSTSFDRSNRAYKFSCTVTTDFGQDLAINYPQTSAQNLLDAIASGLYNQGQYNEGVFGG